MAADLKLVANSFFMTEDQSADLNNLHQQSIRFLQLNVSGVSDAQEKSATSYKTLTMILAAHILIVAGMLHSWPEAEKNDEPAMPMMVSLLSSPTVNEEQLKAREPEAARPIQKIQESVAKQKLAVTRQAATELPAHEQVMHESVIHEPVIKEQRNPEVATDAAKTVKAEAPTQKTDVAIKEKNEAEPLIEPPRFGAAYLNNPAPAYPPMSRRAGEQGRVLLKVLVSESGSAEKVQLETGSGYEKLDQAAIDAVKKWSFIPAKRSNQPISGYVLVPVKFSLNS